MDSVHERSLVVALIEVESDVHLGGQVSERIIDVIQGGSAVDGGITPAEHVQVDTVENKIVMLGHFYLPPSGTETGRDRGGHRPAWFLVLRTRRIFCGRRRSHRLRCE